MQKGWSFLFAAVTIFAVGLFAIAPAMGWWLPKNVSSFGGKVDFLFYLILAITGFFFVLVEALLVIFLFLYAGQPGPRKPMPPFVGPSMWKTLSRPVTTVIYDQHRLEMAWTFVPAVILLIIAFVQVKAWSEIKYESSMPDPELIIEVSARQFEWRLRYPTAQQLQTMTKEWKSNPKLAASWDKDPHVDDIHVVNELHVWKGAPVRVNLKTKDVLHSFYLPNLRLKQDAVPGKTIPVWFKVMETEFNTKRQGDRWVDGFDPKTEKFANPDQVWDLACAELCGWGHYKMQAKLFVHETKEDYLAWLEQAGKLQNLSTFP